jgi:S-phase kinase-associated protein 1
MHLKGENEKASPEQVILKTKDDKEYVIDRKATRLSALISDMLAGLGDEDDVMIPLNLVDGQTLEHVVEYLEHYVDKEPTVPLKPLRAKLRRLIDEWETKYLYERLMPNGDETQSVAVVQVIQAADYLGIKPLLHLCCACIGDILRDKTPQQVFDTFGVEETWSPEWEKRGLELCPNLDEVPSD